MKSIRSIIDAGYDGIIADIECHVSNGLPGIIIVGFASKSVDESKERVRSAFANSSIELPKKRITINLAPADILKDSSSLDLPIAVSILMGGRLIQGTKDLESTIIVGELGLDGSIRAVRGIIGKILAAKKQGYTRIIIPQDNLIQAKLVPGMSILPVSNLDQLYRHLSGNKPHPVIETSRSIPAGEAERSYSVTFQDVVGQNNAKRALEIAAAGNHNILMNGPPGTGKSMLAKALVSILPPLNPDEALDVTHLHSLSSPQFDQVHYLRPFRSPHHTASDTAIVGGGNNPRPGEISLSHRGVLFFDELPEFSRTTLEALRQPLEDRSITVSRAKETITFPANFILVATANPCPCGYLGTHKDCTCSTPSIVRYQRKLSGPIIDRIDLFTDVENVEHSTLLNQRSQQHTSNDIAQRVKKARALQSHRFKQTSTTNSDMSSKEIKKYANLSVDAKDILDNAARKLELSPRSYMRTIKVSRTIADLDNSETIEPSHISEALHYRPKTIQL